VAVIVIAVADRDERDAVARAYRVTGHTVLEAGDANACLQALEKKSPDALVLDPRLPGLEASSLLRNVRRNPALVGLRVSLLAHDMDPGQWEFLGRQFFDLVVEQRGAEAAGLLAAGEIRPPAPAKTGRGAKGRTGKRSKAAAADAPRRILVVEDELNYGVLLRTEFSALGWSTVSAESAEAALELIEKDTFDAVLSDVHLPGMDGCELAFTLRRTRPGVKVLLMTGLPRDRVPGAPPDTPVLPKPISVRQLMAAMRYL
jgi:DNA-binding response OmpR family regulator